MARTDTLGNFLTDVANAIRAKGGTSATIQASNFDTAIANLPSGGTTEVEEKDVNFYDYDGTRIHSYTKTEFLALTSMPPNPTHEGLTAQGWSYTLADAKTDIANLEMLDIGQYFVTDDGATRIYIDFTDSERLNPYLCFGVNGTATINWGDNTTSIVTGTDLNTLVKTQHTYANEGKYIISISGGEILFFSTGSTTNTSMILMTDDVTTSNFNISSYTTSIYKIELGSNMTKFGAYAFLRLHNLKSLTTPLNITSIISNNTLAYCYSLEYYLFPKIEEAPGYCFYYDISLTKAVFPKETTTCGTYFFQNCYLLRKFVVNNLTLVNSMFNNNYALKQIVINSNNNTSSLGSNFANTCRSLESFVSPSSISSILANAFNNCSSLKKIDFTKLSSVPTLNNVNAFTGIPSDCKIIVPDSLYNSWITANNWSTYASQIVKESQA